MHNEYDEYEDDYDEDDKPKLSPEEQAKVDARTVLAHTAAAHVSESIIARNTTSFSEEIKRSFKLYNASTYDNTEDNDSWEGSRNAATKGSRVVQNILRQITNDGASQIGDMLFPTDEDNYGLLPVYPAEPPLAIAPEPALGRDGQPLAMVPNEAAQAGPEGEADPSVPQERPITNHEAWTARKEALDGKVTRMYQKIDATLDRIGFGQIGRKCIDDAARSGTGIIYGPYADPKQDSKWLNSSSKGWSLDSDTRQRATYSNISVLDFLPDMSAERLQDAAYVSVRQWYLKRQLSALADMPAYFEDQIDLLMLQHPSEITKNSSDADNERQYIKDNAIDQEMYSKRYEVFETWADFPVKDLKAAGVKIPAALKDKREIIACVIHCNSIMLGVIIASQQEELPFSVWCWDEDPLSIFGKSIPILGENSQMIYNAGWRMIMDHGGASAVPMITRLKGKVQPADPSEDDSIRGGKVWDIVGDTFNIPDGTQARPFEVHEFPIHLDQFFAIMSKAEEDAYKTTGVTRVDKNASSGGEADNAPLTLGATQIFQNNSSVSRRRQVRNFDDHITKTIMTRQYNWHMEFEEDDELKGAMSIEPRGSSVLMQREVNTQNLMNLYSMTQGGSAEGSKPVDMLREIQTGMQFPSGRFVETKSETLLREQAQAANPPMDPAIQIEQQRLEMEQGAIAADVEYNEAKIELQQADLELKSQVEQARIQLLSIKDERTHVREMTKLELMDKVESEKRFSDLQSKQADIQVTLQGLQDSRDIEAAKLMEKDADGTTRASAEMMTAQAKARDSMTRERELSAKASGTIEEGI